MIVQRLSPAWHPLLVVLLALAALGACGGGDASQGTTGEPAQTASAAAVNAASEAMSSAGTRASCGMAEFHDAALVLLNARRSAGARCGALGSFAAAPALAWQPQLAQAAWQHDEDMAANDFFSHAGSDGSSGGARAAAAGYMSSAWGENIAAGQPSVEAVVAAWMDSDGHCANIMNPAYRDVGLACVSGAAGNGYPSYWTLLLAAQR